MTSWSHRDIVNTLPFVTGAFVGLCVAGAAYGATVALYSLGPPLLVFPGTRFETWRIAGWLFFDAHSVDLVVGYSYLEVFTGRGSRYDIATSGVASPLGVFPLLPPTALAIGGALSSHLDRSGGFIRAAAAGATVIAGYLPAVLFLAVATTGTDVRVLPATTVGPMHAAAVVRSGIAYPVVFGGAGGIAIESVRRIAGRVRTRRSVPLR